VVGKFAKIDIPQGLPVMPTMLATSPAEAAASGGSIAALAIQPGKVGVAFPFRSTYPEKENLPYDRSDKEVLPRLLSVAYAVQPGDRVDVLACFWVYEMDKLSIRLPEQGGFSDPENPSKWRKRLADVLVRAPGGVPGVGFQPSRTAHGLPVDRTNARSWAGDWLRCCLPGRWRRQHRPAGPPERRNE
jgi:hypothetical protein